MPAGNIVWGRFAGSVFLHGLRLSVQNESALRLQWPAPAYRPVMQIVALEWQFDLLEQFGEREPQRLVDAQPQGAAFGMLADVDNAAGKSRILHARHGDEEMP